MLNETLARCYANLRVAVAAAGFAPGADWQVDNPPFFKWDDATCKASFVAPYSIFNQGGTAAGTYVADRLTTSPTHTTQRPPPITHRPPH